MFNFRLLSVLLIFYLVKTTRGLLYPGASVYQITSSFSAPIEIPERKIFLDWGIQINYDLPAKLSQFFNVPIWPNIFNSRQGRALENSNSIDLNKYRYADEQDGLSIHPNDFTAGELYQNLENLLVRYGFHETCLLRSVCELARHPFAEEQRNILTEILTFVLSPSIHQTFSKAENLYQTVYEDAEQYGFIGADCKAMYNECKQDLFNGITKIIAHSKNTK